MVSLYDSIVKIEGIEELFASYPPELLMFFGDAEQAIHFYVSLFKNSEIKNKEIYGPGEAGHEGSIKKAEFTIGGTEYIAIDSPPIHDFTFTPAMSIFVECESADELKAAYDKLVVEGKVYMPLDNYGFSKQFGWVADRFGVSWQLNLKE